MKESTVICNSPNPRDRFVVPPHGFLHLVDVMGSDDSIADAATHGGGSKDVPKLIRHMVRERHTSPFEFAVLMFHVKLPIFVARQWMRHRTGAFNELSGRYEEMEGKFWLPENGKWRKQSKENRQGSSDETVEHDLANFRNSEGEQLWAEDVAFDEYRGRIEDEVTREQARTCLPLSTYTEFYWKVDLHNLLHFLKLRLDAHSQEEIREYARAIEAVVQGLFPITHAAWVDCVRDAVVLTVQDQHALQCFLRPPRDDPGDVSHLFNGNSREHRGFLEKMERRFQR